MEDSALLRNRNYVDVSQSEVVTVGPSSVGEPENNLASHSWPNIVEKAKAIVVRKTSHPFLLNSRRGGRTQAPLTYEGVVNALASKAYNTVALVIRFGWECGFMLVQEVTALMTLVCSFVQAAPKEEKGKLRIAGALCGRQDDQELMELMENQTQILLDINKFLREELAMVKEERDAAEKMISRMEKTCRDAIGKQCEHIGTHSIFDLLYGAGASQAAFGAGGIDLGSDACKVSRGDIDDEDSAAPRPFYGPINKPVSWVKFSS
ncbi:hypothetical protein BV898_11163 [Hypsibius exemplaris]|uniref:Uncharacterized protein n=1 Tax=Hypsibius exemplaris TaxID=2072580 RepID=A0A1W0WHJ5_HYPEX|nr:hypothetical protein BV898_11163 [Hypsibius exemplaris]